MQTGVILLTVETQNGDRLPGAVAAVASPSLPEGRTTVSNAEGEARFAYLPPGEYALTVTFTGFKTVHESNIIVEMDRTVRLTVVMVPATVEEGL